MITFIISVCFLIGGYLLYGRVAEHIFAPDDRQTPAIALRDDVDFVPMTPWKTFLIQLLNIAGTGPIFGALGGAIFGPIVYLWIVLGCIFAGGIHDYMSGMLSERHGGVSISELAGIYLGDKVKIIMRVFSVVLLIGCGAVFTTGPADLLALLTTEKLDARFWLFVIVAYYFLATFIPIDKFIGKVYPIFGISLIIMALGVSGSLMFSGKFQMPELWDNFRNMHAENISVWPFMFVTVACGAISGFHATQSPMMARCMKTEKSGRQLFYGAMIAEGLIALVWAAAGVSCYESSRALLDAGGGCSAVVYQICQSTMGKFGGALALLGVIACPISSGDTAYRSARLTLADWLKIDQSDWKKRLLLTAPIIAAGVIICQVDYSKAWRYFSWANQTLAMIALWTASTYLVKEKRPVAITAIPATFMTAVSVTYFLAAPECLGMLWNNLSIGYSVYYPLAISVGVIAAIGVLSVFLIKTRLYKRSL